VAVLTILTTYALQTTYEAKVRVNKRYLVTLVKCQKRKFWKYSTFLLRIWNRLFGEGFYVEIRWRQGETTTVSLSPGEHQNKRIWGCPRNTTQPSVWQITVLSPGLLLFKWLNLDSGTKIKKPSLSNSHLKDRFMVRQVLLEFSSLLWTSSCLNNLGVLQYLFHSFIHPTPGDSPGPFSVPWLLVSQFFIKFRDSIDGVKQSLVGRFRGYFSCTQRQRIILSLFFMQGNKHLRLLYRKQQ
jgi:hypothetical protein